ncbi:hypothetical protein ACOMHN_015351 [Nucella lapillus]
MEELIKFIAVISRRHDDQHTSCRRHQGLVKFDTTTLPSRHFSLPASSFTAPLHGLYIFSVKFQFQQTHVNRLPDVYILTPNGHILCSISFQNGETSQHSLESLAINTDENMEHRDDLSSAKWGFDAATNEMDSSWFKAPISTWKKNLKTNGVEGFCEGLKPLRQGQQVFVKFGDFKGDDPKDNVGVTADTDAGVCDLVSGFFSGSLLTRDLEY